MEVFEAVLDYLKQANRANREVFSLVITPITTSKVYYSVMMGNEVLFRETDNLEELGGKLKVFMSWDIDEKSK